MTTIDVREGAELGRLAARLKAQFADQVSDAEIERTITDTAADLADAPIRLYVPLFVERAARERLRARVAGSLPHAWRPGRPESPTS
jgi:hypothetical protein